jgi:hypothetical protein
MEIFRAPLFLLKNARFFDNSLADVPFRRAEVGLRAAEAASRKSEAPLLPAETVVVIKAMK